MCIPILPIITFYCLGPPSRLAYRRQEGRHKGGRVAAAERPQPRCDEQERVHAAAHLGPLR